MSRSRSGNVLRKYEVMNLLFFLVFIVALVAFVSVVFQSYRNPRNESASSGEEGIVSEAFPAPDTWFITLGTKVSEASHQYRGFTEIPATDDGFIAGFFAISGIESVAVGQRTIVLQKRPASRWERIQPEARDVIMRHLHMHQ